MDDDILTGRLAAIELMLAQLFASQVEYKADPQRWLADNVWRHSDQLGRSFGRLSEEAATSALEYVKDVMRAAAEQCAEATPGPRTGTGD